MGLRMASKIPPSIHTAYLGTTDPSLTAAWLIIPFVSTSKKSKAESHTHSIPPVLDEHFPVGKIIINKK